MCQYPGEIDPCPELLDPGLNPLWSLPKHLNVALSVSLGSLVPSFPLRGVVSLGCAQFSLLFTISPPSPQLPDSTKKREELEKQLKESSGDKRLVLEELAQLNQGVLATQEQGDSVLGGTLRMNQGLAQGGNRFPVSQSSAGSSDGSIKQV